jgi:hypothetical protein
MNFYTEAPDWDSGPVRPPDTSPKAKPHDPQKVAGPVITVTNAFYRRAVFSGTFLLAEQPTDPSEDNRKRRVKVYCLWYGCRLKSSAPASFLVDMSTATIQMNGGEITTNLRT